MQLALLNHSKNIINDRILFLFELFINLEEKTKQEEYKKITKKHIKQQKAPKGASLLLQKFKILINCSSAHSANSRKFAYVELLVFV